jgi:hypothetical protein
VKYLCVGFLFFMAALAAACVIGTWHYRRWRLKAGAREIYASMKRTWGKPLEIIPVRADGFKHLDLTFYDEQRQQLEELGFRYLIDIELASLSRENPEQARTFVRAMSSTDGNIVAAIFHTIDPPSLTEPESELVIVRTEAHESPPEKQVGDSRRIVEFETRFSDGTFLSTGLPNPADKLGRPPAIRRVVVEYPVNVAELLQRHLQEVETYLESRPAVQPVPCLSGDDVIEREHASHALKCEWRQRIGYLTRPELEKLAEGLEPSIVDAIWEELQRLAKRDQ